MMEGKGQATMHATKSVKAGANGYDEPSREAEHAKETIHRGRGYVCDHHGDVASCNASAQEQYPGLHLSLSKLKPVNWRTRNQV